MQKLGGGTRGNIQTDSLKRRVREKKGGWGGVLGRK